MDYDEGNVTWTDQQLQLDGEPGLVLSRQQALIKFGKYLQHFRAQDRNDRVVAYSDALHGDGTRLRVDLQHVKDFDEDLGHCLEQNPAEFLPALEQAAIAQLQAQAVEVDRDVPEDQRKDYSNLQVLLYSSEDFGPASIRSLTSENVSKLVKIPGIVTAAGKPKLKTTRLTLQCRECKNTKRVACRPGIAGIQIPRYCDAAQALPGQPGCPSDPYQVLVDSSHFVDQQQLKLQERPEDVPTGELPRTITMVVDRHLVGRVAPGVRVTVTAIYSICSAKENGGGRKSDAKGGVAIRMPYLRAVDIQDDSDSDSFTRTFTEQEERDFQDFARSQAPNAEDRILSHIAPGIFGHANIKKAVACLLFGGTRKRLPDGTNRRGDINVLLLGDPSTAKSQFLKFASKTAPIAVYTSGKGSSAAGLTASVIRDATTGEFYLEGGAMVLADNGVVCIDEFDKMRPEDRVAIHEAMEQQTISIAKAGITTMLKSRAAVLAAANPPSGRYDDMKTAQENIDLQTTILSRFDLIFIVKDERSEERDRQIAQHVLEIHRTAGARAGAPDEQQKKYDRFLKRYLEYARSRCHPHISRRASETLSAEYVSLREEVRKVAAEGKGDMPAVPLTVRQLEAIIRIAESLARMSLQGEASEDHVREAIRLFKHSTMDAVKSGVMDGVVFSEEQRAEMHSVEAQIKRRIAIGAHVSERKLVDELVRVGLSEQVVRRALVYMAQQGEVEHRRERRLIHRLR